MGELRAKRRERVGSTVRRRGVQGRLAIAVSDEAVAAEAFHGEAGGRGEGLRVGIAAAGVAELGQQRGSADLSGAGQAGEDRRVRVQGECFLDAAAELGGLVLDGVDAGQQGEGDVPAGGGLDAGQSGGGGAQPVEDQLTPDIIA